MLYFTLDIQTPGSYRILCP